MRINRPSLSVRILWVAVPLLVLCIVSSAAAVKYSPRSAAKVGASASDDASEAVAAPGGGLRANLGADGVGKKAPGHDYVFAKVNNPKLVRPRSKNSRTEEEEDDEPVIVDSDDDDVNGDEDSAEKEEDLKDSVDSDEDKNDNDEDDDDDNDEGNATDDDDNDSSEVKTKTRQHVVVKQKGKRKVASADEDDDRENDEDGNSSEVVDGKRDKNKRGKKGKRHVEEEDDDEEEDRPLKKKGKGKKHKHDDDEDEDDDVNEKKKGKSKKKKAHHKDDDDDDDEEDEKPKKKKKSKKDDDDDDDNDNVKSKKKKSKDGKKKTSVDDDEDDENSHWWNFYGIFNTGKKEEGFIELIQKKRAEENKQIKKQNEDTKKKQTSEEKETEKSWLSYLNRKPFNIFFDIVDEDEEQTEDEKRDTEPDKIDVPMKKEKKKSGPLSTEDFEEILAYIPSFVPNYTSIENIDCRRQGQIFHRQLRGQKLWAFQMIDAGGKIGSGILHGNINQLGNFDLCTEISTKVKITEDTMVRVKGKYCLAHLDIQATDDNLKYLMHLINGKSLLRSTINDPSHFVPRFTTFNWGVCVPAACTVEDVQEFLEASLEDYNSTGIRLNIEIDEENCHVAHQKHNWNKLLKENYEIVAILACVSSVLVVVVLASLNQYWNHWRSANIVIEILDGGNGHKEGEEEDIMVSLNGSGGEPEPHGLLNSLILQFSLKETWTQLTSLKEGEIECVHGIKALASIGLFFILKVLQLIRAPYSNRVDLTEILNSPWTLLLRSPVLFMDIFLILTGFLTSYSLLKRHEDSGKFNFFGCVFGKFIRMLPLIALTTLFQAHIWSHLGSGPQWNEIVGTHSKLCEQRWWKNLLFMQTTDKIEDSCDPISYQFAVQMGLFLLAPIIVFLMHKKPHIGLAVFGAVNALSVSMRFSQTQSNRLAPIFYHGIKMTQIYRTMDMDHGSVIHRATPFINGLGLGFIVMEYGKRVKIPRATNFCLWTLSLLGFVWSIFSQTHVTQRDYVYDAGEMAQFAAWVPLIWSYSLMWIIFACYSGNGRLANKFLSSKPLIFISRISFALHFVQYIVLSSVSAQTRAVGHFEVSHFVNTFELCVIVLASVFLALTFDLPMQNVRDLLRNWEWKISFEIDPTKEKRESSANGIQEERKSTEALFKSNGNVDSSRFDWNKEESPPTKRVFANNRIEKEEHLDVIGDGGNYEEDVEEHEEEEEVEDLFDGHEGGNSIAIGGEEVVDIWGSDNE